jgi:hypothetical protein
MEITRTTRIKLDLSLDTAQRTVSAWTDACNYISRVAFDEGCISNAVQLHNLVYSILKFLSLDKALDASVGPGRLCSSFVFER